jgi:hypothetical protein
MATKQSINRNTPGEPEKCVRITILLNETACVIDQHVSLQQQEKLLNLIARFGPLPACEFNAAL